MSENVFISIDYDTAYKAVVISGPGDAETRFGTGDPVADFMRAVVHGSHLAATRGVGFLQSSSLDGFVFDVPGYRWTEDDLIAVREG